MTDYAKLTRRAATLCACVAALAAATTATASPRFGVAEDATKYADDGGASLYPRLRELGMVENRITVRWNPADPTTIQEQGFLDRALPAADRAGVRIVFDVYPVDPFAFTASPETRAALFAAYLKTVARRYPQVTDYIVGNEPNESYFWKPQFGKSGRQASAWTFLPVIAAGYDALKSVDPDIRVIAAGPSNEGNDKTSTSPVRFLRALGQAYRASGRKTPFMDAMTFHVYPRRNTYPPSRPYGWPNAGAADLARLKQAVWDAFADSPQPTFPQGPEAAGTGALELVVDEFGWQVAIGRRLASKYSRSENVPTVSEAEQARYYRDVIRMMSCDVAVTDVLVFHLIDEPDLRRFQTGPLRIDRSKRPSFGALRSAIAGAGSCARRAAWWPTRGVVGAKAVFGERARTADSTLFGISATAGEDAFAKAGIFRVPDALTRPTVEDVGRSLASRREEELVLRASTLVKAGHTPRLEFRGRLAPGHYVYGIRLTSSMNPDRTRTIVSRVFEVSS
ncbi:MAG TPA: hypothetical protein VFR32_02755 [Gaiellaceae bacterium]|nr:hypothetical protein [Gaiellaceae bacterium]